MSSTNDLLALKYESERDKYARIDNEANFVNLYSRSTPYIKNTNTSNIWSAKNRERITNISHPMAYHRTKIIAKYIRSLTRNKTHKIKILNLGFGSLVLEDILSKQMMKYHIVGIDIASTSVKTAQIRYPRWSFKKYNITEYLNKENKKYDVVVASEIFEHIEPYKILKVIKNVVRVMNKDGIFIVSVPLNEPLEYMLINNQNPNSHTRKYTKNILLYELKMGGLSVERIFELSAFKQFYWLKYFCLKIIKLLRINIIYDVNNLIVFCKK